MYIKETNQNVFKELHAPCFEELIEQITPPLQSRRAVLLVDLLFMYKEIFRNNDYELYDSYTTQKLKNRLINYYGSKISFAEGESNKPFVFSSWLSLADAINTAAMYKQLLKDNYELILPASLKQVFTLLYNGGNEHKILSIMQHIINLKSRARKRMPKHVGLGMSLKNSLR